MKTHRARAFLALVVLALAGSCVSKDTPTGVGDALGPAGIFFQPSVIPSPANADALPINRIRLVAVRNADDAVLADSSFAVTPTDTAWALDFPVRLTSSPTTARVYVYLLNVPASGPPVPQFSGVTETLTLRARETVTAPDFPLVRGPLDNLLVTGITITSSTPSVPRGLVVPLTAAVTTSSPSATPVVFWTSLDTMVVRMTGSLASGVAAGTADIVASAGAFADTVTFTVLPPVASVLVSPDSAEVSIGATTTYTAATFDASGTPLTGRFVMWSTVSPAVATVDLAGVVTGVSAGTTSVIATSEGVSDSARVVVLPPVAGPGGQNSWTAASGLWSTAANWSLRRVPTPDDTVLISQGGDYSVTLDADVAVSSIMIDGVTDRIGLNVGDFSLTLAGTLDLRSWGNLALGSGTVTADLILVDDSASVRSTGTATVGARSVVNGGLWTVTGDSEMALTRPAGIVFDHSGTLSLESGAVLLVVNGNFRYAGGSITGPGAVLVPQNGSFILAADLTIDGPLLDLQDTGLVAEGGRRRLTVGPSSTFLLTSIGTAVRVDAVVVNQGTLLPFGPDTEFLDSLYVEAGATVTVTDGSWVHTADVDNSGTIWLQGQAGTKFGPGGAGGRRILNQPSGLIELLSGGTRYLDGEMENQGTLRVWAESYLQNLDASLNPVAATHVNSGLIDIRDNSPFTVELGGTSPSIDNTGTISVGAGATLVVVNLSDAFISNSAGGVLEGTGTIDFTAGNPLGVNNGMIAPGLAGAGALAWAGSVPMGPTGSIEIELGGTTPGTDYDQLNVGDNLALFGNGALNVATINGFVPSPGDRFGVITTLTSDLDFAAINLPTVPGLTFSTVWSADGSIDTLFVEVSAAPAATLNRWQSATSGTWGTPGAWSLGRVPQAGDSVVIDVDGTYTVNVDQSGDASWITLGGGTGVQTLENSGGWIIGSLNGIEIASTGRLSLLPGSLNGTGTIANAGTIEMANGTIINQLAVDNQATWNILPAGSVTQNAAVTNTGTMKFVHNTGLTAMALAGDLTNDGTLILEDSIGLGGPDLRINSGTLYNQSSGLIQTAGPGTTAYIRGPIANGGTITTTGAVQLGNTPVAPATHTNGGTIGGTARISWTNVDLFANSGTYDASAEVDMSFTGNGAGLVNSGELTTGVASSLIGGSGVNAASGVLTVANGALDISTDVFVNQGVVDVAAGATLAMSNDVTLAPNATLSGSGTVDNTFTTAGVLAGDVAPGGVGQIGTLAWIGDYEPESTSRVLLELGGVGNGESDLLEITGQTDGGFTFAGALVIGTLSYTPSLGDVIPVIVFDERATPFESVTLPTVSGVALDTLWTANTGLANPDTLYIVAKPLPLALSSTRAGVGDRDIWLTAKDGSSSTPLTSSADNDSGPKWSPDGSQIVFTRIPFTGGQAQIWTMDSDGSNATQRTPGGSQSDSEPDWSSDGSRVVYTHNAGQSQDLWYMNKDGSAPTELTIEPGFDENHPDWSPTADSIVFVSNFPSMGLDDIWVMDFQSPQNAVAITVDAGNNQQPQWSPDGARIVFASDRTGNFEVWVMDRDGANLQQLTNDAGTDGFPTWSPDGTQIYFASDRTGNFEIWVMDKDGTNPTQVTVDTGVDDGPSILF